MSALKNASILPHFMQMEPLGSPSGACVYMVTWLESFSTHFLPSF